jgi:hypothetical protein
MTAPSYTEDLSDIDLAEATTNWAESTDSNWDDGGSPTADADYPYIQNTKAISQQMTKASICSLIANNGSGITLPTDGAYFVWQAYSSNLGIDTFANGGMRVIVGSGLADFKAWDVGGSDFGRYPYGGWMNHAVNSTLTADYTVGSPTSTEQYVGAACKTTVAIGKGNPHAVDAVRYGRGSSIFEYGDLGNGYCTFAGFAAQDETSTNRWGLITTVPGGYLWKGKMTLGTATNAVDFRDSNVNIVVDETPKVTANFNTIEVNNASSRVDWDNIKITALGSTSPGRLVCNANADLNWDSCQFTDMGAFTFGGTNSTSTNTIWNGCGLVTAAGAILSGSKILDSTVAADASALNWNVASDPDGELDNMTFVKGTNAHHAIEFGTSSPLTMTVRGWTTSGFNASDAQNDSTFYVARTTGDVTINVIGGSGNFSYKSAGANVTVVISPVTTLITVQDEDGDDFQNVRVLVEAGDGTGDLPFEDTVTITRSGTTASVSHTAHGLSNGAKVAIRGADQQEYNGVFTITNVTTNAYDYTVAGAPATPATGTIDSTGVVLEGLTDVNGEIQSSRSFTVDQKVRGWARKGTSAPYYKSSDFTDVIDKDTGLTKSIQMQLDQ